jgi:hypothetical protein
MTYTPIEALVRVTFALAFLIGGYKFARSVE